MSAVRGAFDRSIDAAYLAASAAAWGLVRSRAAVALERLGLWDLEGGPRGLEELAAELGVAPDRAGALAWMLEALVPAGGVAVTGDPGGRRWRPVAPLVEEFHHSAQAAADRHASGLGASRALIDHVGERYPDFLRGERSGPAILLKTPGLELWEAYFSAANPLYDVHNAACALGLRAVLPAFGPRPRVVELGAGTGGGSAAVLAELEAVAGGRGASLTLTDASPSLLVRTLERLAPATVETSRRRFDFNRPFEEQGIEPGGADIVVAVNALHLAADLPETLGRLARALAPGGRLILSESLCGAGEQVHQEIVFNLLPASGAAAGHPGASRFFTAERWRRALAAAPLEVEVEVNRLGPELALLAMARRPEP